MCGSARPATSPRPAIALGLTCSRVRRPDLRFEVYIAGIDVLLRDLREGDADLAVWVSATGPALDTRTTGPSHWSGSVRLRRGSTRSPGSAGLLRRGMPIHARHHGGAERGRPRMRAGLHRLEPARARAAVAAGFGVMALPRGRANLPGVTIWNDRAVAQAARIFSAASTCARRRCRRAGADRRFDRSGAASRWAAAVGVKFGGLDLR